LASNKIIQSDNAVVDYTVISAIIDAVNNQQDSIDSLNSQNNQTATHYDALGNPTTIVLTENKILQPIFSTRKVTTAVTIWDGQTVAMGGLIREDVQDVEDKVPLLGDIPWIGRLFQTKAEDHFKRNLMIFVTAKLIDPSGQPIRSLKDQSQSQGGSEGVTGVDASGGAGVLPPIK
jgi:general secretion pathway protein D